MFTVFMNLYLLIKKKKFQTDGERVNLNSINNWRYTNIKASLHERMFIMSKIEDIIYTIMSMIYIYIEGDV